MVKELGNNQSALNSLVILEDKSFIRVHEQKMFALFKTPQKIRNNFIEINLQKRQNNIF